MLIQVRLRGDHPWVAACEAGFESGQCDSNQRQAFIATAARAEQLAEILTRKRGIGGVRRRQVLVSLPPRSCVLTFMCMPPFLPESGRASPEGPGGATPPLISAIGGGKTTGSASEVVSGRDITAAS